MNGSGVEKDPEKAYELLLKTAEKGSFLAQNKLGVRYENGQGVPEDKQEAVRWYRLAAEQGDADAQNKLKKLFDLKK